MPRFITLTNAILKEILQKYELDSTGVKAEMVARLVDYTGSDEIDEATLGRIIPSPSADLQNQINSLSQKFDALMEMMQRSQNIDSSNRAAQRNEVDETINDLHATNDDNHNRVVQRNVSGETPNDICVTNDDNHSDAFSVSTGTRPATPALSERLARAQQQQRNYSVKEIVESIPDFDPTGEASLTVEQFVERVENTKSVYDWNEKTLLLAVFTRMKGAAKLWLDCLPKLYATWAEFADAIISEFGTSPHEAEIHYKMCNAIRKQNETITDYCFRICALGRRYGLSDQAIMKYTRDGVQDRELQRATAVLKFGTTKEMRECFEEYSRNLPNNRTLKTDFKFSDKNKGKFQQPLESSSQGKTTQEIQCYNCRGFGHISSECAKPQKRPRCKDCNKVHQRGEPINCGKPLNVRKVEKFTDNFPKKSVKINGIELVAGIDTGSDCDLMRRNTATKFKDDWRRCMTTITGIGGGTRAITECITLPVQIDDFTTTLKFYVVDDELIDTDVLIGHPIFENGNVNMNIHHGHTVFSLTKRETHEQRAKRIERDNVDCYLNDADAETELVDLVNEFREVFSTNVSEIGKTNWESMEITLTSNASVVQAPYRIPEKKKETVTAMIDELLQCDIIEKSSSSYASPILLHKKKDGSDRLCIDYRRLNAVTEREVHPMPNIEEVLHDAKRYKYFTVLDLNSGYYQIPIEPSSRKYTAFVTTEGLYQFKRMPFGLRNAPTVFLRLMSKLKERLQPGDMIHYMDDMLIGSRSIQEMMEKLRRVFHILKEARLTLNLKKCEFLKQTITYLGHELKPDGISPGKQKIKAVDEFPTPQTTTDVRKFLGLSGYFRKFIPGYAIRTEALRKLLRKDQAFYWGEAEDKALHDIKRALTSEPVMTSYNPELEHAIHTDASAIGIAAVLLQLESSNWKPVIYYSRSTSDLEKKFHSSELETLAVVEALERFKYYVYGKPVKVLTDCNAVKSTLSKRDLIPRIGRWSLRVQEFDAVIEHRAGNRMEHVDSLSRTPIGPAKELEEATLRTDKVELNDNDWIAALQHLDPTIQAQINELKREKKMENAEFIIKDNKLFRKHDGKNLWVVPKNLRWKILHECHDRSGHLALDNTIAHIKENMWFSRMRNFAKSYIDACIECAYNKHSSARNEGEYHCDNIPTIPFNTVHLDHLGPFPKSKSRNEHILVLVDAFTKFTIVRPVPSTKTKFVLKILNEVNSYFGTPERIITDRGTAFTSHEFENYCKSHDIKHIKNAVRTPRANGHAERTNRTILHMLLTTCETDNKWDELLPDLQWTLNTLRNKTTQRTPHELLYSFTPRDITTNKLILALHDNDEVNPEELEEIRHQTVERIKSVRQKAKAKHDANKKPPSKYDIGDLVLVEHEPPATGSSRKLEPRYKGPYMVTAVLGHDRYAVEDIPGTRRKQKHYKSVYAFDKMKAFNPIPEDTVNDVGEDEEEDHRDEDVTMPGRAELKDDGNPDGDNSPEE